MEINEIQNTEWADIFNVAPSNDLDTNQNNQFSRFEENTDIFKKQEENQNQNQLSEEELKAEEEKRKKEEEELENSGDIFIHDEDKKKAGRKPKYEFSDTVGYFEDRVKNGRFVPIEEEDKDGNKKTFIPSKPEEFDEFFDLQLNHKLSEKQKELETSWYESKSPAWKAIAQYAELTDDINEVLPFIQTVKNIESISSIDVNDEAGAEKIIRYKMQLSGDSEDIINDTIDSLKETKKLIKNAESIKPFLIQQEQQRAAQLKLEKEREQYNNTVKILEYREEAIKAIEQPLFGSQKLKKEEQATIYELIAEPDSNLGGYAIYNEVDKLYEKKDFETLKMIALILANKDSFFQYSENNTKSKVNESLTRKLKVANKENVSSTGDSYNDSRKISIPRNTENGFRRF